MDKSEMSYFEMNLNATMAYLAGKREEPDDALDQYRQCVGKALKTIRNLDFELTKQRAYNNILVGMLRGKADIVRCMDCKHCFEDGDNVKFNVCELNHNRVQPDQWYCADGEVRPE